MHIVLMNADKAANASVSQFHHALACVQRKENGYKVVVPFSGLVCNFEFPKQPLFDGSRIKPLPVDCFLPLNVRRAGSPPRLALKSVRRLKTRSRSSQ